MSKKLRGKALAKFEAERDVWQEVLDGVREIKAGGGKRTKVKRTTNPRNKGLVKLLLSCPLKDWFQPLERTETTDDIKLPKLG